MQLGYYGDTAKICSAVLDTMESIGLIEHDEVMAASYILMGRVLTYTNGKDVGQANK